MASTLNKTVIIDYGSGNVKSLYNTITFLGYDCEISNSESKILSANKLIFPGQGHFGQAVENFKKSKLEKTIIKAIDSGVDFLGICLGLQILFEKSEEAPNTKGLGIIEGEVKKFQNIKTPQIGWNKIKTNNDPILCDDWFYFVNSYYICPKDTNIITSTTNYGIEFASSIKKDNLTAVQFHPEKSSSAGLKFFRKWLKL